MKFKTLIVGLTILAFSSCQKTQQSNIKQNDIIFTDSLGNSLTKKDLIESTGQANYEITRDMKIDSKAQQLHQEARQLGQEAKYDLSIAKLNEAIKIQPNWAYPIYDLAYTYLLKGNFAKALEFYKKTDELEPKGFFTSKTAIYSLEGEQLGKFPKGLYLAYMQIEWADNTNKKIEIARAITKKVPTFAPAWKELSSLLDDKTERLEAIEKGLSSNPDTETEGILQINKALILASEGKKEEAKNIVGNLIFLPQTTTTNVELAKFVLKTISEQ
ncbi:hypothetical protein Fleli_0275 [Bernardetia litoralis DSM 6794]|uniref:Uncharacterized protein n=1 Tax=Bernardetia litoralis (strain ATCC 23117 / DSM 6794 / NBRC 15988 / NCIMB 1366 / Fx l1 / Sio-4) TaxID=880071 RepID=I4AFM9_BERLS|nr:tetratricopeptide repeat protein [Bernardetia litoralis]AFM02764.1 hypothetical protein Fleli_0275 [Bernardetia litoralis DSM 6794]